jgi:hypothetical protein
MQEPDGPPPAFPMTIIKSNPDKCWKQLFTIY